jgi:hypothetical protein
MEALLKSVRLENNGMDERTHDRCPRSALSCPFPLSGSWDGVAASSGSDLSVTGDFMADGVPEYGRVAIDMLITLAS